ncbi:MAG: RluA family pseudouridine synthase [Alkalispirochaeta sp.]
MTEDEVYLVKGSDHTRDDRSLREDTSPDAISREVTVEVDPGQEGVELPCRLDVYLGHLPELPGRSRLKQRISALHLNGRPAKLSTRVLPGDTIAFHLAPEVIKEVTPEEIPLDILYEDDHVVVINKPSGMVVHPGAGNWSGTLLHALAGRYPREGFFLSEESDEARDEDDSFGSDTDRPVRPGIVHRLDKETSGVIIVAKDPATHRYLVTRFSRRRTKKYYLAVVKGSPPHTCGMIDGAIARDRRHRTRFEVTGPLVHRSVSDIDAPIDGWSGNKEPERRRGKPALTTYRVLRRFGGYSFVLVRLHTGRTHQIRVHFATITAPILGDPLYARPDRSFPGAPMMLHALRLTIAVAAGEEPRTFKAPVPPAFRETVRQILGIGTANKKRD